MGWKYSDILPLIILVDALVFVAVSWIYFRHGRSTTDMQDNYYLLWLVLFLNIVGLIWAIVEGGAACRARSDFGC